MIDLRNGDCLEVLPTLDDSSVSLIVADPPYMNVKRDAWDRQWATRADYLDWLRRVVAECQRVLAPNGSLYLFASPEMAAKAECVVAESMCVLNHIVWHKDAGRAGWSKQAHKEGLRSYFPQTERIIFAEQYGADNAAKGESGYVRECDKLRGFLFEPLRAYLADEWQRAGLNFDDARLAVGCADGSGLPSHWFTASQWMLPTREKYEQLRAYANRSGGDCLKREYDCLKREYDDLKREYESLRRPFSVTPDVPYTDVWDFPTVQAYRGKHPCEKPLAMIEHIVRTSSVEGGTVLDPFMGSGVTGDACRNLGRRFIGIEKDAEYYEIAKRRIEAVQEPLFAEAM